MNKLLWLAVLFIVVGCNGQMRVVKTGLGSGTVTSNPPGINCGADCAEKFPETSTVTLTANPAPGSSFAGWGADCSGSDMCTLSMAAYRAVRAQFDVIGLPVSSLNDLTPQGIRNFLNANPLVDTAAKFLAALPTLPQKFKDNWIMMTRSESLQTGIAASPRVLLPSEDSVYVFSFALQPHASFPLANPNTVEYMQWDNATKKFGFHEINLTARTISINDAKCTKCHSGRPNWDAYDSWAGMTPFNRDRIYQSSAEAATIRKTLNPWSNDKSNEMRVILEQLALPAGMTRLDGGFFDGWVNFPFDNPAGTAVLVEPATDPALVTANASYYPPPAPATAVPQGGKFFRPMNSFATVPDEGRGVDLFDHLTAFNAQRVARDLVEHPRVPVDVRPIALAIANNCVANPNQLVGATPAGAAALAFFEARNGMTFANLLADTNARRRTLPRRKADIQKVNLDGPDGLIAAYGVATNGGADVSVDRIRKEVFRRPPRNVMPGGPVSTDALTGVVPPDNFSTDAVTGMMIDREVYNTEVALYRFFLEPLGVAVDKWSMSVRGRSRTYTFADLFGTYTSAIQAELQASLPAPHDCATLITKSQTQFAAVPPANATPSYAEVQKIFSRNCTECHGGLGHPPYMGPLDLSEGVSYPNARARVVPGNPAGSSLMNRITRPESDGLSMPQGGPTLSQTDIETIKRWILGGANP